MYNKTEELSDTISNMRNTISSLEEINVKEKSEKLVSLSASIVIEYLK